jgi:hypothetical protein
METRSIGLTAMFDPVTEGRWRNTPAGMAHWAGTGPPDTTCRSCIHFQADARGPRGFCERYRELMPHVKSKKKFDRHTQACRYYEPKTE